MTRDPVNRASIKAWARRNPEAFGAIGAELARERQQDDDRSTTIGGTRTCPMCGGADFGPPREPGKPGAPRLYCVRPSCRQLAARLPEVERLIRDVAVYATPDAWAKLRGHVWYLANARGFSKPGATSRARKAREGERG